MQKCEVRLFGVPVDRRDDTGGELALTALGLDGQLRARVIEERR